MNSEKLKMYGMDGYVPGGSTDYRNYYDLQPDISWYSPDYYCCGYNDTKGFPGDKIIAASGCLPIVMSRVGKDGEDYPQTICRVKWDEVPLFVKAMEQMRVKAKLEGDRKYELKSRMVWDRLDDVTGFGEFFKPRAEQIEVKENRAGFMQCSRQNIYRKDRRSMNSEKMETYGMGGYKPGGDVDYRNYYDLQPDGLWYSPDYYCCAYHDTKDYSSEEILTTAGCHPLIMNRVELDGVDYPQTFCRVKWDEVPMFVKAMEQMRMKARLENDDDYEIMSRFMWDMLDDNDNFSSLFKPRAKQLEPKEKQPAFHVVQ